MKSGNPTVGLKKVILSRNNELVTLPQLIFSPSNFDISQIVDYFNNLPPNSPRARIELSQQGVLESDGISAQSETHHPEEEKGEKGDEDEDEEISTDMTITGQSFFTINSLSIPLKESGFTSPLELMLDKPELEIKFLESDLKLLDLKGVGEMTATAFLSSTTQSDAEMIVYDQAGLALYSPEDFLSHSKIYITSSSFTGITKLGDLDSKHLMLIFEWKRPEMTRTPPVRWSVALKLKILQENQDSLLLERERIRFNRNALQASVSHIYFITHFPFNKESVTTVVGLKEKIRIIRNQPISIEGNIFGPKDFDVAPIVNFFNSLPQNPHQACIELRKPSVPGEVETFLPHEPRNPQGGDGQGEEEEEEEISTDMTITGQSFFAINSLRVSLKESGFTSPLELILDKPEFEIKFLESELQLLDLKGVGEMTATAFLSSTTQPNPEMIVYDQAGLALYNENGFVFDSKIYITASSFTDITKLGDLDSRHLMLIFEWRTPETLTNLQRWSVAFKLKVLQENKDLLLPQWYRLKIDPNVLLNSPSFVFFSTKFPFNNKLESLQLGWMKVLVYQSNPPSYMYLDIDAPVHFDIIDSVKFVNGLPQNAPQARIELRKPSEPEEVETFVPQGPPPNSQGEAVQDEVVDVEQEVGGETEQEEKGKGRRPKVDTKETLDKEDEKKDNVGPRKGNGPGGKNGPRKKEDPQKENERGEAEQEGKGGSKGNPKATQDKEDVKKEKVGPQNENEPGEESGTLESSGTSEATQSSPPCIIHLQCVTRLCCMQGALDSSTSNFQDEVKSETKKEMKKPKEVQSIVSEQNQEEPNSGSTCSFSFVLLVVSLVFEFVFW